MCKPYQLAAGSTKGSQKKRNGDAHIVATFGPQGAYLGIMLADGVGSTSKDWLASSTACQRFKDTADSIEAPLTNPEQWLAATVKEIDATLAQSPSLLLCAATIVIWEIGCDAAYYANIGDTRLYQMGNAAPAQISTDESKAVIRRGVDGKPLYSGGSVVVQRGITQALGSGHVTPNVAHCPFALGDALILVSDGFYGDPQRFSDFAGQVTRALDLEGTVATAIEDLEGGNDDDATTLVLRRTGEGLNEKQVEAILTGVCTSSDLPLHVVYQSIVGRLDQWIAQKDETNFLRAIDYLADQNCLIPQRRIEGLTKTMLDVGWNTQRHHSQLQTMLRRHYQRF